MVGRTIQVFGFPHLISAEAAKTWIEKHTTKRGCVYALEVKMSKGASRAYAIVQFSTSESSEEIINLAKQHKLYYRTSFLTAKELAGTHIMEPKSYAHEMDKVAVCFGCQTRRDGFHALWRKRNVSVKFGIGFKNVFLLLFHASTQYKLQLSREGISKITQYYPQHDQNAKFLVIQMFSAPRIYKNTEESIYTFFKETPDDRWVRTTDFTQNCIIGQSSALCMNLHLDIELPNLCDDFAYDNQIVTHFTMDYSSSFSSNSVLAPIFHPPLGLELPFKLHFKICSLVQHGCIPGPSLNDEFLSLVDPRKVDISLIEYALEKMYRLKECCYDPVKWLTEQYSCKFKHKIKSNVINLDEGLMYVRRVIVTPMRVYFCGPDAILSNRVLRYYYEDIDNFIRVSFMDEDWERMHSVDLSPYPPTKGVVVRTDIFNRIMKILENGIVIGDKAFEFLAFSSSQLRESSLWMFASRPGLSATDIRSWMGDFKMIKNVAKYAARLGQSFGSSRETFVVGKDEIQIIPDIEIHKEGKNYTFSDGIGKISADFAQKVAIKCGLMKHPSAFQIRYGGFKGVVSVDPSSSWKLSLRKSMLKFESENIKLDILAWSRYQPCYLNRQIITLLSSLGIHDEVFEKKQEKVVGLMDKMLMDPSMAQKILKLMPSGENTKLLIAMLNCGYKPHTEPFLSMMLQTIKASMVEDLRTRTRILIPDGRSMMGCMDETRTLEYGQVFIRFSIVDRGRYSQINEYSNILVGKVVVAKNPCLHPGDVRILQAIDVPVLHHMVDCVVFPQQGDRPHPNECSGSDLDGDFYYVCWDQELIPRSMVPPMDYTPAPVTQLECDVTIEDIRKYFVEYIMNDSLGMISNAHVVVADREPNMAMSEPCMQLAHLFSIAVDFPKTGVPAEMPPNLRIKKYPDFMQKLDKPAYKSTRIIGKLFRQVKSTPRSSADPFTKERAKKLYDMDMQVDGFEDHICEAFEHKKLYDYKLGSLMDYYDIKTEAEMVSGRITNPTTRLFDRRRDFEAVILAYRSLRKEARSWFEKGRNSECSDDLKAKASAWYHVTYHHTYWGCYEEEEMRREHFISFPWCIYEELIQIKKDRSNTIWGAQFSSLEWTCNIC